MNEKNDSDIFEAWQINIPRRRLLGNVCTVNVWSNSSRQKIGLEKINDSNDGRISGKHGKNKPYSWEQSTDDLFTKRPPGNPNQADGIKFQDYPADHRDFTIR